MLITQESVEPDLGENGALIFLRGVNCGLHFPLEDTEEPNLDPKSLTLDWLDLRVEDPWAVSA